MRKVKRCDIFLASRNCKALICSLILSLLLFYFAEKTVFAFTDFGI